MIRKEVCKAKMKMKNARYFLLCFILMAAGFCSRKASAEIIEISSSWLASDFTVTAANDPSFDPNNPQFDGKIFGVAPSSGSATIRLQVDTILYLSPFGAESCYTVVRRSNDCQINPDRSCLRSWNLSDS